MVKNLLKRMYLAVKNFLKLMFTVNNLKQVNSPRLKLFKTLVRFTSKISSADTVISRNLVYQQYKHI